LGSAEAILAALDAAGPLEFEQGELDTLLSEIEQLRELDLDAIRKVVYCDSLQR
jgi:hypothetical protein